MSIIRPPENRTFGIGRIMTSEGQFSPVVAPRVTFCEQGGQVEDPEAGLPAWTFRRLASPTISYVDGAGLDTIRDRPEPGDVLQDELGPALFTSPIGEQVTGFWEECKRVTDSISAAGTAGTIDRLE